jgi:hypothetical protein
MSRRSSQRHHQTPGAFGKASRRRYDTIRRLSQNNAYIFAGRQLEQGADETAVFDDLLSKNRAWGAISAPVAHRGRTVRFITT